jgi:CubicO group peptidase (beta-lactamase class C family)
MSMRIAKHAAGIGIVAVSLIVGLASPTRCAGQSPPPLSQDVEDLARQLESESISTDAVEVTPPSERPDPAAPVNALRTVQDDLRTLMESTDDATDRGLNAALLKVEAAWGSFAEGSEDLTHLGATADELQAAEVEPGTAARVAPRDMRPRIAVIRMAVADIAARMAGDVIHSAQRAGVRSTRLAPVVRQFAAGQVASKQGKFGPAVGKFGGALKLAINTVHFDVALFEQNIKDALAGQTTGHAFSIAYLGQLYQDGESFGQARTAADAPATAQSPSKEMHVASVSKTLTSIVILRLLQDNGLTPDTPVNPYLPSNWTRGTGVSQLTFRDFMTHTSGFGQKSAGTNYAGLQTAIAQSVNGSTFCGNKNVGATAFCYSNANFALMRVLASRLAGVDPADYDQVFDPGALSASVFLLTAQTLYQSIGVSADCKASDATPTVQYNFPDDGTAGYVEPNRQLDCGGFGWFVSSNELAAVLANLRQTENLLSKPMRKTMQEGFLGFMDPANYGFIGGTYGVYSMHGGDWFHGAGELHSCVVAFPIRAEVGLVINSERGAMSYQCALLQTAFDNAWVAS